MPGYEGLGAVLLMVAVLGLASPGCAEEIPDPAAIREAVAKADRLAIRVVVDQTGAEVALDLNDRAAIEELARLLAFKGKPRRTPAGAASTNNIIRVRIVRDGRPDESFAILASRTLQYGPDEAYMVQLEDDRFARSLRGRAATVRDRPSRPSP